MFQEKKFPSGLRLITAPNSGTQAITLLILTAAGSRNEAQHERGISHFLEHMFFKGGEKYVNAKAVAEAIDGVGGDFNAFTGKEYAGYYVKVASDKIRTAFDVLSDMLIRPTFLPEEIDKERGVILEELNMYEDTPMYQVGWDFERLLFGNHPMGWDQIGTKEVITTVTQEDFFAYKKALYTPENTVITVAGNVTPEQAEKLTTEYFSFPAEKRSRSYDKFSWKKNSKRLNIRNKKTEQAHLILGYPGLPMGHDDEYAQNLLAIILGGNMSSRMFQNIREAHGLCYSISSSTDRYTDCGVISTTAGVDITRVEMAIKAIRHEYEEVAAKGVEEIELQKAKNFLQGKITLRLDDPEERASFFGTQALLRPEIKTLKQVFAEIDAVTTADILRTAQSLFVPEKLALAMIGPFAEKEAEFQKLIN